MKRKRKQSRNPSEQKKCTLFPSNSTREVQIHLFLMHFKVNDGPNENEENKLQTRWSLIGYYRLIRSDSSTNDSNFISIERNKGMRRDSSQTNEQQLSEQLRFIVVEQEIIIDRRSSANSILLFSCFFTPLTMNTERSNASARSAREKEQFSNDTGSFNSFCVQN